MTPKPEELEKLKPDVGKAVAIVQKLTSTKEEMEQNVPKGTEAMPRSELHFCKGLAFTFVKKAGIGLSYETGTGFVIAKLPGADGTSWTWSAPCFINVNAGGIGVTLGYSEIESVVVLDSVEAVKSFTHTNVELDTDITGAAGSTAATHLPATAANITDYQLTDKTFTYSITKGVMVDVSLTGLTYTVAAARNQAMYGEFASAQAILDGGVKPPAEMKPLYDVLDHVLGEFYDAEVERAAQQRVEAEAVGADEEGAGMMPVE